jgi:hypothetical protein
MYGAHEFLQTLALVLCVRRARQKSRGFAVVAQNSPPVFLRIYGGVDCCMRAPGARPHEGSAQRSAALNPAILR